jgi:peptide/nickel transport system ATP-binding protein
VTASPLLTVSDLSCAYDSPRRRRAAAAPPAVHKVSFDVAGGSTVGLVGESGSGKTTISRTVAGLMTPRSGQISYLGSPLPPRVETRSNDQRRDIQYVFQNPDASLNPRQRVRDILGRPLQVFLGHRSQAQRRRVAELLEDVQLDPGYAHRFPAQLSGGERQRVAIARALAAEPRLVLCDEILTALDVSVQHRIMQLLRDLQSRHGLTYLFVSHDLAAVRSLADDIVVLKRGEVMEHAPPETLFTSPKHPYTRLLVDSIPRPDHRLTLDDDDRESTELA